LEFGVALIGERKWHETLVRREGRGFVGARYEDVVDPDTGERIPSMPQKAWDHIEWIADPNTVGQSEERWCKDSGVGYSTMVQWKRKPIWRRELERRCAELNVSPQRLQSIVNALYGNALRGDVRSAELYMRYVDRLTPQKVVLVDRGVAELSDAELDAKILSLVTVSEDVTADGEVA
jgi:hypothetical protein